MRILAFALLLLASGLAQKTPLAVSNLYAQDLQIAPAVLEVSPGYTTLVEFFAPIGDQFVGNSGLVDIKTSSNLMVIFPKERAGETDLIIRSKGYAMLFLIKVVERGQPRRYVVNEQRPAVSLSAPTTQPTGNLGSFRYESLRIGGTGVLRGQVAEVRLNLQNLALDNLIINPSTIRIAQNNRPLDYLAYRKLLSDKIGPLESQEFQINIPRAAGGLLEMTVQAQNEKTGALYNIRAVFDLSDSPRPARGIEVNPR
jgi:hypothetical protein